MTVSVNISRALMEITGEPRAEVAIIEVLKDAVEHRMEKLEAGVSAFEAKYGMSFSEFESRFGKGDLPEPFGYETESDFLDWEGLTIRLKKYRTLLDEVS